MNQLPIETLLQDLRNEPAWRPEAAVSLDYYDNNQLSSQRLQDLQERGMEPVVRNVIAPAINALLGMEERNRRDAQVLADDESDSDEALALSREVKETERLSGADRAVSDAFAYQAKIGVGWVEVRDNDDPFGYHCVAESPRWQELWWDWRGRHPLLDDARYLVRRKWFDLDVLKARFVRNADLIEHAIDGWPAWHSGLWESTGSSDLMGAYERESVSSLEELEWRNAERRRLALFEVWYRTIAAGTVLRVPELDLVVEFDRGNPVHVMAVESGMGELSQAPLRKMRRAYWVGPHLLSDEPSPYAHNYFPYVPFFGFREDRTGIPYGLIRLQKSPQDEANRRLSKMDWLLSAKSMIAEADAFLPGTSPAQLRAEAASPSAFFLLNPNRINKTQPLIREHADMSAQQFNVLQDALKWVSEVGGIYQAMLGKTQAQQSGVAINSLVEQGSTTQGELFGNYALSRTRVLELLLSQAKRALQGREKAIQVRAGSARRTVVFNQQQPDGSVSNALTRLNTRVVLSEVPSTASFRQQMQSQLVELTKSLPPELQAVLIPSIVRGSDLPHSDDVAQLLERAMGQGPDASPPGASVGPDGAPGPVPPTSDPGAEQQAMQAQARQQQMMDFETRSADARVREGEAKADKALAEAQKVRIEVDQLAAQVQAQGQSDETQLLAEAMQRRQMRLGAVT